MAAMIDSVRSFDIRLRGGDRALIEAALNGSSAAVGELVRKFQDLAEVLTRSS